MNEAGLIECPEWGESLLKVPPGVFVARIQSERPFEVWDYFGDAAQVGE